MSESIPSSADDSSLIAAAPSSNLGRVARGSAANLAGAGVSAVASFVLVVVLTHGVSKAEAGVLFSVTSLFLVVVSVGQLGTDLGLVYFLSRARALGRHSLIDRYLRAAFRPVLSTALAMSVALFAFAPQIGELTNTDHADLATGCLRVLAVFITPACLATVLLAATRGMGTMRANVAVEQVGRQLIQLALVAIAIAVSTTVTGIVWAYALPYVASFVAALLWWRRLRRRARPENETPDPASEAPQSLTASFWRFTAPRTLASVAQLLMQRIDIVLVGALASAPQAAVFTAATRFVVAGQMGSYAVSQAVQPALAATLAQRDLAGARHLFQTSAAWLIGITWPLYLTFCVHANSLLAVFGSGYRDGGKILVLVSIGLLIGAGVGDVDSVLVMSGRTALSMVNTVLGLVVMIGVDVWLIPDHGAVGAGIGWGTALSVKNLAGLVQVQRTYRINSFGRATLIMATLSVVCFGAISSLARLAISRPELSLVTGVLAGSAAFLLGLWVFRSPLQLREFRALRTRTRSARSSAGPSA